ncbi:hypothetical protein Catovirus_1_727 [Catovirus CTV1]|uniref:Uncharacterized protein n=1 Tax=Catovirus CTV1 TaxID=1977631 RepID=A0A1V0SAD4_9VIRU|nr:hypothetical protein Catovirus_1_727 [Catovirus CTV1]
MIAVKDIITIICSLLFVLFGVIGLIVFMSLFNTEYADNQQGLMVGLIIMSVLSFVGGILVSFVKIMFIMISKIAERNNSTPILYENGVLYNV